MCYFLDVSIAEPSAVLNGRNPEQQERVENTNQQKKHPVKKAASNSEADKLSTASSGSTGSLQRSTTSLDK